MQTTIAAHQGKVIATYGLVSSVWITSNQLPALACQPEVRYVRHISPHVMGSGIGDTETTAVNDDGFANIMADCGLDGTGTTIGVISDSYNALGGANAGIASGDLPGPGNPNGYTTPVVIQEEYTEPDASDEIRAMMEIIHDLAPAAALVAQTGFNGRASYAAGITNLAANGVDIIVSDIYYISEPFFQDGLVSQAFDAAYATGVSVIQHAGNFATSSYESAFVPSGTMYNGEMAHDFNPGAGVDIRQSITILAGGTLLASLQWDDPDFVASMGANQADSDLNFYLLDGATEVFSAQEDNITSGEATEFLDYVNTTGGTVTLEIIITKAAGPDPALIKYVTDEPWNLTIDEYATNSPTIVGSQTSDELITVGGTNQSDPTDIYEFTSIGGNALLFDDAGNLRAAPLVRNVPTVVAPQGVNTYILRFPVGTASPTFELVTDIALNYPRTLFLGNSGLSTNWNPWLTGVEPPFNRYPMPLVNDIDFDKNNNLIVGVADQNGHYQGGLAANGGGTVSAGDLLRINKQANGSYGLEDILSGVSTDSEDEFFIGDGNSLVNTPGSDMTNNGNAHREGTFGYVAVLPGEDIVISPSIRAANLGGIRYLSTETGFFDRYLTLFQTTNDVQLGGGNSGDNFAKAANLGDIEFLCSAPPIQIGNFAWIDEDEDGVQDSCEPPLPNIPVKLLRKDGTNPPIEIANTLTDASGNYYFTSSMAADPNLTWTGTGADAEIIAGENYFVAFCGENGYDAAADTLSVDGVLYCITDTDTGEGSNPDLNDSDITELNISGQGTLPGYCTTAGEVEQTNPTFDAGFKILCPFVDLVAALPPLCSNDVLDITGIVDSIFAPDTYDYVWSTSGDGSFLDSNGLSTTDHQEAVTYEPGPLDIINGGITLTLSSSLGTLPANCEPVMDSVDLTLLQVDCGTFPWGGN